MSIEIPGMTAEERERYLKSRSAEKADPETSFIMSGDKVRAKNKIEIHFGPDRTTKTTYNALVTIWESGKHFHGGGDDLSYWCLDCRRIDKMKIADVWKFFQHVRQQTRARESQRHGCGGIIQSSNIAAGMGNCPSCRMLVKAEYLTGHLGFHGSTGELATFIAGIFNDLNRDADIYTKFHREDIRYKVMEQKLGSLEAHRLKGLHIYPLANIIRDLASGSSAETRFKAFFTS